MIEYVDLGARSTVALVFAVSVFGKARSRAAFAAFTAGIRAMRVVPSRLVHLVAIAVVVAEAAVPPLLIPSTVAGAGFAVAATLLIAFTTAILAVLRRGTVATCPCFSTSNVRFGRRHIARNGVLLTVVGFGAWAVGAPAQVHLAGGVVAVVAGAIAAAVVVTFEDIVDLFAPAAPARLR